MFNVGATRIGRMFDVSNVFNANDSVRRSISEVNGDAWQRRRRVV